MGLHWRRSPNRIILINSINFNLVMKSLNIYKKIKNKWIYSIIWTEKRACFENFLAAVQWWGCHKTILYGNLWQTWHRVVCMPYGVINFAQHGVSERASPTSNDSFQAIVVSLKLWLAELSYNAMSYLWIWPLPYQWGPQANHTWKKLKQMNWLRVAREWLKGYFANMFIL